MVYKELYKACGIPKLADSLAKRSQDVALSRQEKQRDLFWEKRNTGKDLSKPKSLALEKKVNQRAEMFYKWKRDKFKKLEEEKKKKKPIFKVGIVQRSATGSPLLNKKDSINNIHNKKNTEKKTQKVVSRSKTTVTDCSIIMEKKHLKECKIVENNIDLQKKFCKIDTGVVSTLQSYKFKPPQAIAGLSCNMFYSQESSSTAIKRKPKIKPKQEITDLLKLDTKLCNKKKTEESFTDFSLNAVSHNDNYQSIYNVLHMTIKKKKKSNKKNELDSLLKFEGETRKEENEFQCKISLFRNYIECETKKLLDACSNWKNIMKKTNEIPSDVEGEINSVIGKTNLLTSDKFVQFQSLIDRCEKKDPLVKLDDLHGFQDWVTIEIQRINSDFNTLEKKKNNNWKLEAPSTGNKKCKKSKSKKAITKPVGKSNIRYHIEALRKEMKEKNMIGSIQDSSPNMAPCSVVRNVLGSKEKENVNDEIISNKQSNELETFVISQKCKNYSLPKKEFMIENLDLFARNQSDTLSKNKLSTTPIANFKHEVKFKNSSKNFDNKNCGLDEKYFRPVLNGGESPFRLVLGDLKLNSTKNVTRGRACNMNTCI